MSQSRKGSNLPVLSGKLEGLSPLASNFYFVWNRKIRKVFEKIDPAAWYGLGENPVALLQSLRESRIRELESDSNFCSDLADAYELQRKYLHENLDTWYKRTVGNQFQDFLVAYFSAEFGVASCLRTYAGGLGILSGDHLKSASDLGLPLVGVGIFYRRGYFSQNINHEGWQTELYPENNPDYLPVVPVLDRSSNEPLTLSVPLADRQVRVRAWKASVGRVSLYLLDTNVPGVNTKEDCEITSELYGGDSETRIKQEIVLGCGGARLLRALQIVPTIFHMNEGHSAFVGLERISELLEAGNRESASFDRALSVVRSSSLFTTHTPVPAGIDIFSREQIDRNLAQYTKKLGISSDDLFSLGQERHGSPVFNMAVLAIRLSANVNAVSKLHREVARKLWDQLLKEESFEIDESHQALDDNFQESFKAGKRMSSVTNGIHTTSWISDSMADILDEFLGRGWSDDLANPEVWRRISEIPSEIIWQIRNRERTELVRYVRQNFLHEHIGHEAVFDPNALTIGFARRFATYKRATLLFSDLTRLEQILSDPGKPVQVVFAGKAHPRDYDGKRLIQEIAQLSKRDSLRGRIMFLPDYDISVAKHMVRGVDLWLNNPRRPLEASGTSGMKVVPNGGLNLSVLDGWWDEAFTPSNGWAIGTGRDLSNPALQDREDAESLYDVLTNQVIPEFYDRSDGTPRMWVERIKRSISALSPRFNTNRMVMEYARRFYFTRETDDVTKAKRELGIELTRRD